MKTNFLKKLFIIFCVPYLLLSKDCFEFFSEVVQKQNSATPPELTIEEAAFLSLSDPKPADVNVEKQDECESVPSMKYFVAVTEFVIDGGLKIRHGHGTCLPQICNSLDVIQNQAFLKDIFVFRGWFIGNEANLYLYNPEKNMRPKTAMFYITCIIFALFLGFTIFSTIKLYLQKKKAYKTQPPQVPTSAKPHWLYKSFDLNTNIVSLYKTAKEQKLNENIAVFNFLRVVTSIWVILFHNEYPYAFASIDTNTYLEKFHQAKLLYALFLGGNLSVDYFFIMTGFLCAYTLVPKLTKQKIGIISYFTIIKHRFFRVWPILVFAFLYWWQLAPQLFNGPLWFLYEYNVNNCDKPWWSKIFLVENFTFYYKDPNHCMLYTWYIAAEFQMYLIAVITLIVYVKRRRMGFTLIVALICQGFSLGIANCLKHKIAYPASDTNQYYYFFYKNPYVRWYPLFIGVVWGLLYYEYSKLGKKNIFYLFEKKVVISYISMTLGLALNIFVVLFPLYSWKDALDDVWYPLRVLFNAIGITMIFMPLVSNRDFYLKRFMNLRIFQILGKCSFTTYMYHESWISVLAYTNPAFKYDYSSLRLIWFVLKVYLCTQPTAFIAHLIFEKPLMGVEGHFTKKKPVAPKNKTITTN